MSEHVLGGLALLGFACWLIGGKDFLKAVIITMAFGLAVSAVFSMF
ncbi:hypothetical protein JQ633_08035 [Bradyrhizobium tropiciagri]|nr:hypothetical protein [Bradyrhizobium tropiciagri]MBR0870301.1 hypothetical protein [Bradyrhizobium tropiciagri]